MAKRPGRMSIARSIRCASALLDHRLTTGDGHVVLRADKTCLRSPQSPLYAHPQPCPSVAAHSAERFVNLLCTVPTTSTTDSLNSNPHSAIQLLASSYTARGFLPQGLSDAYRRPC
jgi:hypothetical protein